MARRLFRGNDNLVAAHRCESFFRQSFGIEGLIGQVVRLGGPQRFDDRIFPVGPAKEIDFPAALAAKRSLPARKIGRWRNRLATDRTRLRTNHRTSRNQVFITNNQSEGFAFDSLFVPESLLAVESDFPPESLFVAGALSASDAFLYESLR